METSQQTKAPFYQSTWFIVLMMFCCCFPIGLFLMWKYKKFNIVVRFGLTIFFVVMFVIAIIGGKSSSSTSTSVEQTQTSTNKEQTTSVETTEETTTVAEKSIYGIGDSVEQKNVIVTFNSATETEGSQFIKPSDGNIFLLAEFTIENNSDKELAISSMLSFDAYQDGFSTSTSFSALTAKEGSEQLDGSIAPGKKMKGVVGYEIPRDYKEFEVSVQLSVWSNKKITFGYTKE